MAYYFVSIITVNLLSAVFLAVLCYKRGRSHYAGLLFLNLLLLGYHLSSYQFHLAQTAEHAILLSRWHSTFLMLAVPAVVHVFGTLSGFRYTHLTVTFLTTAVTILVGINWTIDGSLRYGAAPTLEVVTGVFGEPLSLLRGTQELPLLLFHGISLCLLVLLGWFAVLFYRREKYILWLSLVCFLFLQTLSFIIASAIDAKVLATFYIGGLPLSVLSLGTIFAIGGRFRSTEMALRKHQKKTIEMEKAFARIAKSVSVPGSDSFYQSMVTTLYDSTLADMIILGQTSGDQSRKIKTIAAAIDGNIVANFSYELNGTPCKEAVEKSYCFYGDRVHELFPDDKMLRDQGIQSYLGVCLTDNNEQTIGILALLFRRTIKVHQKMLTVLDVFAARAGAELERDSLEKSLQQMAYYDYLSRLPNRALLLDKLNQEYQRCRDQNTEALFCLIDIDNFGDINRRFGNEVADQVIRLLGEKLSHYVSESVFIARIGGDEFAVLIRNILHPLPAFIEIHWDALKSIIIGPWVLGKRRIHLHCSMGVVVFPTQVKSRFEIISAAETAIFQSKEQGKEQYTVFVPDMLSEKILHQELRTALVEALKKEDELFLVYQPKVSDTGPVIGAEALIRWQHPERGFISPGVFIPLAEQSGLIHDVGKWVIEKVCETTAAWEKQGYSFGRVSLNIAASQLEDENFVDDFLIVANKYECSLQKLEVEITETSLLADIGQVIKQLERLRQSGIAISLDDFGTGYSSLSYLKELPLDVIKIDKSFVDSLADNRSAELIKAIIAIGQSMKLDVLAEGTETEAQVATLSDMGCALFQGYYFSKPLKPEEFIVFLAQSQNKTSA